MAQEFLAALKSGHFTAAYEGVVAAVKAKPNCADTRAYFATFLCYQNEFDRAEKQLQTILSLDPSYAPMVNAWRHLLGAAQQRHLTFTAGAVPDLVGAPTTAISRALKVLLAQRGGLTADETTELASVCETLAQTLPTVYLEDGAHDDAGDGATTPQDWQDLDDRFTNIIEVIGGNGKYYWFDIAQVAELSIERPSTLLEHLWLPAKVTLVSGETGHVSLPTIYPSWSSAPADDLAYNYGQKTDWCSMPCQETSSPAEAAGDAQAVSLFKRLDLTMGLGLRTWLVGDESQPILSLVGHVLRTANPAEA